MLKNTGWKEINLPNICIFPMDVRFLLSDGTTLTDVCTENTDVGGSGENDPGVIRQRPQISVTLKQAETGS